MNDFKRNDKFGGKRTGGGFGKKEFGRPSFGGKPPYQRGGFGRPQGQMYPATCANCGKATEVPFLPDGHRPIYCRDCLGGNKPFESAPAREFPKREFPKREFPKRDFQKPAFRAPVQSQPQAAPDTRIDEIQKQLAKLHLKLDQILLEIAVAKAQESAEATVVKKKKPSKKK